MDPTPKAKYQGRCHCGLFRFTLNIAPLKTLWTCNCSICTRVFLPLFFCCMKTKCSPKIQNGYLWIHPVEESQLSITMGEEKSLHTYHFAMRGTTHLVCWLFLPPKIKASRNWREKTVKEIETDEYSFAQSVDLQSWRGDEMRHRICRWGLT